jgi:topoisomerase-4 subunit A
MGIVPKVMSLSQALGAWLEHRKVVLVRRSQFRLEQINHRIEILGGYLVAYLNIDEVIRIVREEDHPKIALIKRFEVSETQAEAILNMRLRSLRKLEEFEIRKENKALLIEQSNLNALLGSEKKQWGVITTQVSEIKEAYGEKNPAGARRTTFEAPPKAGTIDLETALIEKEPVTIILSKKGTCLTWA